MVIAAICGNNNIISSNIAEVAPYENCREKEEQMTRSNWVDKDQHSIFDEKKTQNNKNQNARSTVMICEEDPDLSYICQQIIDSQYNLIAVRSGTECLNRYIEEKVKGNQIDLLILDYKLHDLTGDIVATTIRELGGKSETQITNTILVSTFEVDEGIIEELKRRDCITGNLRKPVSAEALMNLFRRIVN